MSPRFRRSARRPHSSRGLGLPGLELLEDRTVPGVVSDSALPLLNDRASENAENFFVYKDQDSAFNHGNAYVLFPDASNIAIDTGCVNDPSSSTGCTTDPDRLDPVNGNILFVRFDPLTGTEFAGLNIEEQGPNSYDLSGATDLVFEARSPTAGGVSVQFGFGGGVSAFMTIPQSATFSTIRIPLADLSPTPSNPDILFTIATNAAQAPGGGIVLLDNVRFEPVPTAQPAVPSLPLANTTFGILPRADDDTQPFPPDQVLRNLATTYESALTAVALLARDQSADRANAFRVADALTYAPAHDNAGFPVPPAPSGATGLHNGYSAGDLPLLNPETGTEAGQVRFAGFTAGATFNRIADGATAGNNAFAIIALADAYQATLNPGYLQTARSVGNWIAENLLDDDPSGFGGYFNGYDDGTRAFNRGKSVENNADIFAAFDYLARLELARGDFQAARTWQTRAKAAGDFVMAMFDPAGGRFFAGTVPAGTAPSPGIVPTGPQRGNDVTNVFDYLDANTIPVLAMACSAEYRDAIDWRRPVQFVLDNFARTVVARGRASGVDETFQGFGLTRQPADGIAWEFTAQAVAAMRHVDRVYNETNFDAAADQYLSQLRHAQLEAPFGDGQGLVAATLQAGQNRPLEGLVTPFQTIYQRVGLAATSWAAMADLGTNPLQPDITPGVIVAVNDAYQVVAGETLTVAAPGILANDTNPCGHPLQVVNPGSIVLSGPGTLTVNADGSFTYVAPADARGQTATFQYQATDGVIVSNVATVTITIPTDPPVAVDDSFSVTAGQTLTVAAPGILANDTDPQGNPLQVLNPAAITLASGQGTLAVSADGSFTFTPAAGFFGLATFLYQATDGVENSNVATVRINVTPVPPPPGVPAFAVGSDVGGGPHVRLFDTRGDVVGDFFPFFPTLPGGARVATGDVTGDGTLDLVVGSGPGRATQVLVFDGNNLQGQPVFAINPFEPSFFGGVYVAVGDMTGDGTAEIVITPDEGGGPRVRVFRGGDFAQINDFLGIEDPAFRGGARAAVADLNGDGVGDLLVAAGFGGGPRIAAFDGTSVATGTTTPAKLFGDIFVFENTLRNGVFIAGGDLDGDGFADLIAGGGPGGGPRVFALSGQALVEAGEQVQVANFFAGDVNNRGGIRLAVKELNGDGRADLLTGSGTGGGSLVTAYPGNAIPSDGAPGETLFSVVAFPNFGGGVFVG